MLIKDVDIQNVLTTAGFIVEGMMGHDLSEAADTHDNGCIGLISEATSYAPYIERLWAIGAAYLNSHNKSSSYIWPYDLVSPFGSWYALTCITDKEVPDQQIVKNYIIIEAYKYFIKDNGFTYEQQAELLNQLKLSA